MVNVGEIVTRITSAAGGGGLLTYRPGVGEQFILLSVGGAQTNALNGQINIGYGLTDGALFSYCWKNDNGNAEQFPSVQKIGFDNTNYLFIENDAIGAQPISFSAIRVK